MKSKLLFLLALTIGIQLQAQTVSIPDTNFEQALIDLGKDSNGLNGNILLSEAEAIDSLKISDPANNALLPNVSVKIKDLTGLESMTNLVYLDAGKNELSTVNVTANTKLNQLFLGDKLLTATDVSQSVSLERLGGLRNQITS